MQNIHRTPKKKTPYARMEKWKNINNNNTTNETLN